MGGSRSCRLTKSYAQTRGNGIPRSGRQCRALVPNISGFREAISAVRIKAPFYGADKRSSGTRKITVNVDCRYAALSYAILNVEWQAVRRCVTKSIFGCCLESVTLRRMLLHSEMCFHVGMHPEVITHTSLPDAGGACGLPARRHGIQPAECGVGRVGQ